MKKTGNEFGDYSPEDLEVIGTNLVERIAAYDGTAVPPGAAVGFTDEYFDALYTLAVRYYNNKQFREAGEVFKNLCTLQPDEVRNYKGAGANALAQQEYQVAVKAYTVAYMLSATDADTSFYLGQAFFFLKDYQEAHGHLRFAREMAGRAPAKWPQIATWSTQLLERIETRQKSAAA